MTNKRKQSAAGTFEAWWKANKWKGVQWYPVYLAEDAYQAGFRAGRKPKAKK